MQVVKLPFNINLSSSKKIFLLHGKEILNFLQGQLTCDLENLQYNKIITGAYCNIKGRVLALIDVFVFEEKYYIAINSEIASEVIADLNKYSLLSRIKVIEDNSFYCYTSKIKNELAINYGKVFFCYSKVLPESLSPHTLNSWPIYLISNGYCYINQYNSARFLPHDLNLPNLGYISFDKGCYKGQEIISRMQYKANLKKQLCYVRFDKETENCINVSVGNTVNSYSDEQYNHMLITLKAEELAKISDNLQITPFN